MQVLALLSPSEGVGPDIVRAHAVEENRAVWEMYRAGVIREMLFRTDRPGAVFRLETDSVEEARSAVAALPMVAQGLLVPEFIPVGPFVPLENLFSPSA
jgi:hypothetical protein